MLVHTTIIPRLEGHGSPHFHLPRPSPFQKEDGDSAALNRAKEPDMYKAGSQKESVVRKQHRESPGSLDTGRKGGSSTTEKFIPRAGRSAH
jgi:hypothetical protein